MAVSKRQERAVRFCEEILHIKFQGDISNWKDVSNYLRYYLDEAKATFDDACESYYSEFMW